MLKMSKWKYKLEVKDLWEEIKDNKITIQELSKQMSKRIKLSRFYKKHEDDLEPIVNAFEDLSEDKNASVDEFDDILSELYDWGDQELPTSPGKMQNKMCWINTF